MNKEELQSILEAVRTALTGDQSKLDKNGNKKIDREDFALLRSKKKPMAENADLHGLLEQLYAVLLDEKAARLQEAPYGGSSGARYNASRGQSANPQNFYNVNRNDNDEIRASIYREDEKRKREEKERLRTAQMDQMENTEYDSILEKIYNLLAEDAPPFSNPIDPNPLQLPWWGLNGEGEGPGGFPLYPTSPIRSPTGPMPPLPGPMGLPGTDHHRTLHPRPILPNCEGGVPCTFEWVYTVHWVWNSQYGFWELVPNSDQRRGGERDVLYGGYWRQRGSIGDREGLDPTLEDSEGNPLPPPPGFWQFLRRDLGLNPDRPTGYAPRNQHGDRR
jgi:hypothetical protein